MINVDRARKALKEAQERLERNPDDPHLVVYILRDHPDIYAARLDELCWVLARDGWECHRNDVVGVLELFGRAIDAADDQRAEAEAS